MALWGCQDEDSCSSWLLCVVRQAYNAPILVRERQVLGIRVRGVLGGTMKTLVVSLFAGPGAGKSTLAAGLFHHLKQHGIPAELVLEYAKDKIYERAHLPLDSLKVWARQRDRLQRVLGQVPIVITDGAPLLAVVFARREGTVKPYAVEYAWTKLAVEYHRSLFPRKDIFLTRNKPFVAQGRHVPEEVAQELDKEVHQLLHAHGFNHSHVRGADPMVLAQQLVNLVAHLE